MKFNLGSGNNFIVKNSNIVIQQQAPNQPPKEAPAHARSNSQGGKKQAAAQYLLDNKTKFTGSKQFAGSSNGFNSTKARRGPSLAESRDANYNVVKNFANGSISAQNASYVGKQRQMGQSPNNFSGVLGVKPQKKRGASENQGSLLKAVQDEPLAINQNRRAQSKIEKYEPG